MKSRRTTTITIEMTEDEARAIMTELGHVTPEAGGESPAGSELYDQLDALLGEVPF